MNILIVGADRLGKIPEQFYEEGIKEIIHWSGRNKSYQNKTIPKSISKVIVFCDFLNHNLMKNIKKQAKAIDVPIIYSKRNLTSKVG